MHRKVWIFNHHAALAGHRHYCIATHLSNMGFDVTIIASSNPENRKDNEARNKKFVVQNINPHVRYIWINTKFDYKSNGIKRILNMLSFLNMSKRYSKQWWNKYGKPNIVIGSSVHPLAWEAAMWVSKKVNAVYFAEVRDIWPLGLMQRLGYSKKHLIVRGINYIADRAYENSKKVITTMPFAYKYICDELGYPNNKVVWIPNGIDTLKVDKARHNNNIVLPQKLMQYLEKYWCCIYTGSLVSCECIDYIIKAAKVIQSQGFEDIHFAIIGDGNKKNEYMDLAEKLELDNIAFFPRISSEQVAKAIPLAKVCLAAVLDRPMYKYGLSMNKLNDYLYSGIPTVFACNVENIVSDSGAGIVVSYGDIKLYTDAIIKIYGMNEYARLSMGSKGPKYIKDNYDMKKVVDRFACILKSVR